MDTATGAMRATGQQDNRTAGHKGNAGDDTNQREESQRQQQRQQQQQQEQQHQRQLKPSTYFTKNNRNRSSNGQQQQSQSQWQWQWLWQWQWQLLPAKGEGAEMRALNDQTFNDTRPAIDLPNTCENWDRERPKQSSGHLRLC
ncbi:ras-interacting protein RIP3-like [Drosophila montana]|uniref:ras-interacting protein RIP3-like n=1 Tax=Drosophila montana TaxID=40370 RepID=UPI00313CEFAB